MKAVYNNFLGGLAPFSDRIGPPGSYAEARDIDIHRTPGYIRPGFAEGNKTTGGTLTGIIIDAVVDPGGTNMYAQDDALTNKLYRLTNFGTVFTSNGTWPHTITGSTRGEGLLTYPIGTTNFLFAAWNTNLMRFDFG